MHLLFLTNTVLNIVISFVQYMMSKMKKVSNPVFISHVMNQFCCKCLLGNSGSPVNSYSPNIWAYALPYSDTT